MRALLDWLNPGSISGGGALSSGLLLAIFFYWGWDGPAVAGSPATDQLSQPQRFTSRSHLVLADARHFRPVSSDRMQSSDLSFASRLPLTQRAIAFASEHHASQRREGDRAPFVTHPLEVASYLEREDYPDYVVAAAVLHDVLEDTDVELPELESRFGSDVSELVALVSDDPTIEDQERQKDDVRERVRHAGGYAAAVYAADKVSKVRELRTLVAQRVDPRQTDTKLRRYWKSLDMLDQTIPGTRVVELLRFELEAFVNLPPAAQ